MCRRNWETCYKNYLGFILVVICGFWCSQDSSLDDSLGLEFASCEEASWVFEMEAIATARKYNNYKLVNGGGGKLSPERAKVWKQSYSVHQFDSDRQRQEQSRDGTVAVVYYLCRNRQVEQPHFIEVPISSPNGHLYLRDVIERLNLLRGRGMALMYSWSSKRSYKNGFVWHDLCEYDVILPAHGNEYVLKGSELFEDSNSGHISPAVANIRLQSLKSVQESLASRHLDDSCSRINQTAVKNFQLDESSPPLLRPGSSAMSTDSGIDKITSNGSLGSTEHRASCCADVANASTQTDENGVRIHRTLETCMWGVPTDDTTQKPERNTALENQASQIKVTSEIHEVSVCPLPSSSSESSMDMGSNTLESLIRADASKLSSFRIIEEDGFRRSSCAKFKASNMLLQLISCGSTSVKDGCFNFIPSYKPSFTSSRFTSTFFSQSLQLGAPVCQSKNQKFEGLRTKYKGYFSGTLVEMNITKEDGTCALKRSSSYNAERCRTTNQFDKEENDGTCMTHANCTIKSKKDLSSKQPRSESMRSATEEPGLSSTGVDSSQPTTSISNGGSKSCIKFSVGKNQASRPHSSNYGKENMIEFQES